MALVFLLVAWPGLSPAQSETDSDSLAVPVRKNLSELVSSAARQPAPQDQTTHPLRVRLPDPLKVRALSANFHPYPDAALFDNSDLLEAPAGQRGFVVTGPDGRLQFEDGSPARFWGVTITQEHIDVPKARIEEVVDVLARAGCNMVRFHSLDNRAGEQYGFIRRTVLDEAAQDTETFDPEYLDRLHYWMARLKQRGIYSYIVLRGFRHYRPADQVSMAQELPRGATPYAFFNGRLIQLQKSYARALLFETINPYTGLPPGRDPSVALIELFNEDSLFARPERWQVMLEPYGTEFRLLWNRYLADTYGNDKALAAAWQDGRGKSGLLSGESIHRGTVGLPSLPTTETLVQARNAPITDPLRSPARRRDAVRFAIQLQRQYFQQLSDDLRHSGLRVPITGVVAGGIPADTYSVASELDFTAENAYLEHPAFEPGVEWNGVPFFRNKNHLASSHGTQWISHISRYHWMGSPLAVREWNICWPNSWRSSQMPEMAAYARFQGWDCILSFGYFTTTDLNRISAFGIQNDPTRWGLFAHGARIFLGPDTIQPAQHTVAIRWSPEDLAAWGLSTEPLHSLAYQHRVVQVASTGPFVDRLSSPTLTILSGRTHDGFYPGQQAILHAPAESTRFDRIEPISSTNSLWAQSGYSALRLDSNTSASVVWELPGSSLDDTQTTLVPGARGFLRDSILRQNLQPYGLSSDGRVALGGVDSQRKNVVLGQIPVSQLPRIATEFLRLWEETPTSLADFDAGILRADTGEIIRDTRTGRLVIDSPRVAMISGAFTTGTEVGMPSGRLRVQSLTESATVVVLSLDGKPLQESKVLSIKLVTEGSNRNQRLVPSKSPRMKDYLMLASEGTAPIVTRGRHQADGGRTTIKLPGLLELHVAMENGTLECLLDLHTKTVTMACDLPNARIGLELTPQGHTRPVQAYALRAYQHETLVEQDPEIVPGLFVYPGWAKLVTLRWD